MHGLTFIAMAYTSHSPSRWTKEKRAMHARLDRDKPFTLITVNDVEIDCCCDCRSIWFAPGELQFFFQAPQRDPFRSHDESRVALRLPNLWEKND